MRPSMNTSEPFFRYCCAISACLPHTTILCHSVRFWRSPFLSLYVSSVATEKFATACPPPVKRVSGSRPNRPTRIALFTDMCVPAYSRDCPEPLSIAELDHRREKTARAKKACATCATAKLGTIHLECSGSPPPSQRKYKHRRSSKACLALQNVRPASP